MAIVNRNWLRSVLFRNAAFRLDLTELPEIGFVPANPISDPTAPLSNHAPGLDGSSLTGTAQYLNCALSEGTDGTTGVKDSQPNIQTRPESNVPSVLS